MASERTIVHYSKDNLSKLENSTYSQRRLLTQYGKPMGFWYAYGDDWKNFINAGKVGDRNASWTTSRYEFKLPETTFITNVADASRDKIFELSQSNFDMFMKKYSKDKYKISKNMMLETAFYNLLSDGESAVLNEISDMNEDFSEFCDSLMDDNDPNIKKIMKKVKSKFPDVLSEFSPSDEALASDRISKYSWMNFWENVSNTLGGVEFHTDLFEIGTWNGIDLPWTGKLDIRSGIIFHPDTFRNGILMEQLRQQFPKTGGNKRRTMRKKRELRRKTNKRL